MSTRIGWEGEWTHLCIRKIYILINTFSRTSLRNRKKIILLQTRHTLHSLIYIFFFFVYINLRKQSEKEMKNKKKCFRSTLGREKKKYAKRGDDGNSIKKETETIATVKFHHPTHIIFFFRPICTKKRVCKHTNLSLLLTLC